MPRNKRDYDDYYRKKDKRRSPDRRSSSSVQKSSRHYSPDRDRSRERSKSSKHHHKSPAPSRYDKHYSKSRSRRHSRSRDRRKSSSRSKSSSSSSSSSSNSGSSSSSSSSSNAGKDRANTLIKEFETILNEKKADLNFFKSVDQLQTHHNVDLVDKINADEFVPQGFKSQSIAVNLKSQTISVPKVQVTGEVDVLIHPNFLGDDDERMKRWVKKMFLHRQRLKVEAD